MAPAGQAWSTVDRPGCGGPTSWPPATPTCWPGRPWTRWPRPQPPAAGLRARPPAVGGRRPDACAGTPARCPGSWPACSWTARPATAASLLTNATHGLRHGVRCPRMLLGDDVPDPVEPWRPTTSYPSRSRACPGCGSGATPPWSCAGTAASCGCTSSATPTTPTSSSCAATGSSASRATTAARPSTYTAATTARSATSSARRSSTPACPTTPTSTSPAATRANRRSSPKRSWREIDARPLPRPS